MVSFVWTSVDLREHEEFRGDRHAIRENCGRRPFGVRDGGFDWYIDVPAPLDYTPYGHYGDWFAVACGAVCLVTAFSERIRRAHEKSGRLSA